MTERNNERMKKRNNIIIHHRSAQYLIRGEEVAHLLESITCNTTTAELYNWIMGEGYIVVYHLWDTYGWTINWRYDAGSEKNYI